MARYYVLKADGRHESFSEAKFVRSMHKAQVPPQLHRDVVRSIKRRLKAGVSTNDIHRWTMSALKPTYYPESRYNLKRAIMALGPTGFPFEEYFSLILQREGYSVTTGKILSGRCVNHEVDIIARKDGKHIFIECKYHNAPGIKSDIKIALYTYGRYEDLMSVGSHQSPFHQMWLVTNTKCTSDAIHYASCMGMKIISWGYPQTENLQYLIEKNKLYPVSCLQSLSKNQISILLGHNIILVEDLIYQDKFNKILNLSDSKVSQIINEAKKLLEFNLNFLNK